MRETSNNRITAEAGIRKPIKGTEQLKYCLSEKHHVKNYSIFRLVSGEGKKNNTALNYFTAGLKREKVQQICGNKYCSSKYDHCRRQQGTIYTKGGK